MYRQLEKNLLNSNDISSTCPHNMVKFGPLTAESGWRVTAPQQISTGFASWLRLAVWAGTLYITLLKELCQVQSSLCVQVLRSPVLACVTARHCSSGRQPNLYVYNTILQ